MTFPQHEITLEHMRRSYKDKVVFSLRDDSIVCRKHTIHNVVHRAQLRWLVTVTLHAQWPYGVKIGERIKGVESVCSRIQFERIQLLWDTVTELVISSEHDAAATQLLPLRPESNPEVEEIRLCGRWLHVREYPYRILYPPYSPCSTTRAIELATINKKEDLTGGVHKVRLADNDQIVIYKQVDRPLYLRVDTYVLEQEFRNLKILRGVEGVVQLAGAVVSPNPYQTSEDGDEKSQTVFRGILVQYHPNGTLQHALQRASPPEGQQQPWLRWAKQIASGLRELHQRKITHMDLKPSNVVIDKDGNAVLIDIGGRGITLEYLSPEMKSRLRPDFHPHLQPFAARVQNDMWAYGKMLRVMAAASQDVEEQEVLESIASQTEDIPRIALEEVVSRCNRVIVG